MTRIPQRYRLLQFAMERGWYGFTRADAMTFLGVTELAARIGELERENVSFSREAIHDWNRYGDPVRYTRYRLAHCPKGLEERVTNMTKGRS